MSAGLIAEYVLPGSRLSSAKVISDLKLGKMEVCGCVCCAARLILVQELKFDEADTQRRDKLLCMVLTYPGTHATKAKAVARTWGPLYVLLLDWLVLRCRCDLTLFITSEHDEELDTVAFKLSANDNRKAIWEKIR
jgi:hypothetical protein